MSGEETVNTELYCETMNKLRCTIQNKRRGVFNWGILLLHENIQPNVAGCSLNFIKSYEWEKFDYPSYSPDFVPTDFHVSTIASS